jgi:hypothetical protein
MLTQTTTASSFSRPLRSPYAIALLATVSLLGACATGPASMTIALTGENRVETVRELRHFGPQGKSAPIFVTREVQTRAPAVVGSDSPTLDR